MTQIPRGPSGFICPFHQRDMSETCHLCPLWIQVRGMNPQTGKEIDEWNCSFTFLPMLLIENAKQQRSTTAATESFRNEMTKSRAESVATFMQLSAGNMNSAPPLLENWAKE